MATGVGLTQISLTPLNLQTLKPPIWLSYSRFSDELYQFLLP